jgi:hypothetical protein
MNAHQSGESHMKEITRLALLEQSIGHINETLMRLEKKIDLGFERGDKKFEKVEQDIKDMRSLSWSHFRWIMGALLGLVLTLATIFMKGHLG